MVADDLSLTEAIGLKIAEKRGSRYNSESDFPLRRGHSCLTAAAIRCSMKHLMIFSYGRDSLATTACVPIDTTSINWLRHRQVNPSG